MIRIIVADDAEEVPPLPVAPDALLRKKPLGILGEEPIPEPTEATTQPEPPIQEAPVPEPEPEPAGPEDYLKDMGELPDLEKLPFEPAMEFEEQPKPPSRFEEENKNLGIPDKIWVAIDNDVPLKIEYTTLKGTRSSRTVWPKYVHWAGGHRLLVAWCEMVGDWRAFIVNTPDSTPTAGGITSAELVDRANVPEAVKAGPQGEVKEEDEGLQPEMQ